MFGFGIILSIHYFTEPPVFIGLMSMLYGSITGWDSKVKI
jgi:hypothetical protein